MGLQKGASYVALACFWLLGIPLAAIFAFKCDFGIRGLLAGFLLASGCQALSYLWIILLANWQDIANAAVERINKEEEVIADAKAL